MNNKTIIFAKIVIYLTALAGLSVCIILVPELLREESVNKPLDLFSIFAVLTGAYTLSIPFFVALFYSHKLLNLIAKNKAFTKSSVRALQYIKNCTMAFMILVLLAAMTSLILARIMDPREDVTFVIPLSIAFIFITSVMAVFIDLLKKILIEAISLKAENKLIV